MSLSRVVYVPVMLAFCPWHSGAQPPLSHLNPTIQQIVSEVSSQRIEATLKKLEGFGTRFVLSENDGPTRGIGAAEEWIAREFKSYSPRLVVEPMKVPVKKGGRVVRDTDLVNVVATLPGTVDRERYILVGGHYDSMAMVRKQGEEGGEGAARADWDATAKAPRAPGVTDDGSGTAAVLELARVLSKYQFDKTLVFVTFSGEEVGLLGSKGFVAKAKAEKMAIEAMLNNDVIGSEVSGNGRTDNSAVRVFSEGPEDSPSRALARYAKEVAERYMPSMTVDMIFRRDRFSRSGDHTAFSHEGYAAVRFSTPNENYANQHSVTDTFANTSVPYTTRVVKMNAAVLASLALAPQPPVVMREVTTGPAKGRLTPMLSRGKSGYDAALKWKQAGPETDLAGYAIVMRATTSPLWQKEVYVGNVNEYTFPNLSIDDIVIGVKAVDKDGNGSLVSVYEMAEPAVALAAAEQAAKERPASSN